MEEHDEQAAYRRERVRKTSTKRAKDPRSLAYRAVILLVLIAALADFGWAIVVLNRAVLPASYFRIFGGVALAHLILWFYLRPGRKWGYVIALGVQGFLFVCVFLLVFLTSGSEHLSRSLLSHYLSFFPVSFVHGLVLLGALAGIIGEYVTGRRGGGRDENGETNTD